MVLSSTLLTILTAAASPHPATVVEIPHYDIAAKCDRALGLAGCVEVEHASLGALQFWWRKVGDRGAKEYCISQTSGAPFLNYTHLMHCIADKARLPAPALASGTSLGQAHPAS